jgi:serine/threonine-protein kinase
VVSGDDHEAAGGIAASFAAGSRIAGYQLEQRIGQGGMAVVFRARDERLDRLVALKILAPTLAGDAEFRRRFTSESRAAAAIDDPHIVPVFAAGEADGVLFIAMRYVSGGDAQSLLARAGPLPPGRAVDIISPVASALDAAHRAGLVHRDVKPSNMLMDVLPGRPDHVYLSDFGLSKAVASTSGVTSTGMVLGTLSYMSPEQVAGKQVDGRADQYALACSAFELLAGAPPFRRGEPMALMYAHLLEPPPPLTSRRPDLPPAVDDVMSRALAKEPGDRYASCGQFADALRGAFGFPSYRGGPSVMPPAETALPATVADAQPADQAGEAAVTLLPTAVDRGPGEAGTIPAEMDTVTGVTAQLTAGSDTVSAGDGGQQGPSRWPWRRIAVAAFVVAAAAGLAVALLPGGGGGGGSVTVGTATVPIAAKSALPALNGDVYVVYLGGQQSSAQIYGEVKQPVSGEVARLYAQQFPYRDSPAPAGSVTLHPAGTTASYAFQVTPTLATRYRVELFQSGTAATPLATSGVATVYVMLYRTSEKLRTCGRPVCNESLQVTYLVPPSALQAELSKRVYLYFGINLSPSTVPSPPQYLSLGAGDAHATTTRQISADEFGYTVTFSFQVGADAFELNWRQCTMATEAADGIGLPGHHACGDERIPAASSVW